MARRQSGKVAIGNRQEGNGQWAMGKKAMGKKAMKQDGMREKGWSSQNQKATNIIEQIANCQWPGFIKKKQS
jgi:hypothetical protein